MPVPTAANVIVGKPAVTGGVLYGPTTVALPEDATTALPAGLSAGGYVSSDGVTQTLNTDSTDITAWGGDTVRTVQTGHSLQYAFTLIETNGLSLAAYYGAGNVTGDDVRIVAGDLPHQAWVIEVRDGDRRIRIVIPDGQVTDRDDVTFTDDSAVGYGLTITCYPDADGVKAYIYSDTVGA